MLSLSSFQVTPQTNSPSKSSPSLLALETAALEAALRTSAPVEENVVPKIEVADYSFNSTKLKSNESDTYK